MDNEAEIPCWLPSSGLYYNVLSKHHVVEFFRLARLLSIV